VSAAVQRCLKAKAPGPLASLLFPVASVAEAKQLAKKHLAESHYALDLVDRLDDKAASVLERLAAKAEGSIAQQWKSALELL
jgi:hypothetical protein